jgi:hypothetical protein
MGKESLTPHWWMDRSWRLIEEIAKISGLTDEIRRLFSNPDVDLSRMRDDLEARRLGLLGQ